MSRPPSEESDAHTADATGDEVSWQATPVVRGYQRRAVSTLVVAQVAGGLAVGAGSAMGSLVAYEVTQQESLAGLVRVVSAVAIALLAGPLAWWAVRHGRRVALATGWGFALVGALILLASLWIKNLPLLVVGAFFFSAGNTANLQTRFAATDMELPDRRGRTLSLVVWAATIGAVGSPMLAGVVAPWAVAWGLPKIAGVYLVSVAGLIVTAVFLLVRLRPDPMHVAQDHGESPKSGRRAGLFASLPIVWRIPAARLAIVSAGCDRAVMVAVMALTPVHMAHTGHHLDMVGLVLSVHILGMFAFSPIAGWLADVWGSVRVILVGMAINAVALVICILAGSSLVGLFLGLFLLGLGWSFADIASSTLLVDNVGPAVRTTAQGVLDSVSNLGAAAAAGLAGVVMQLAGYSGLAFTSAAFVIPVVVWAAIHAVRTRPRPLI